MSPLERLKYHVSGAVERGESEAIIEQPAPHVVAYRAAVDADNAFQAELDRLGVERYSNASKGALGSDLRRLYNAKLAADDAYHAAIAEMRRRYFEQI